MKSYGSILSANLPAAICNPTYHYNSNVALLCRRHRRGDATDVVRPQLHALRVVDGCSRGVSLDVRIEPIQRADARL